MTVYQGVRKNQLCNAADTRKYKLFLINIQPYSREKNAKNKKKEKKVVE